MAYSQTILWDYVTDNNNQVPFGFDALTLHDSIDNYDELLIEMYSKSTDSDTCFICIPVTTINNSIIAQNYTVICSFDQRSSQFYISGTTYQKTRDNPNQGNINGLVRMYGIKY